MQMGMTRRCLGRSAAASKEEEEDKKRLKQVNNACSLFLNRAGQLPPLLSSTSYKLLPLSLLFFLLYRSLVLRSAVLLECAVRAVVDTSRPSFFPGSRYQHANV